MIARHKTYCVCVCVGGGAGGTIGKISKLVTLEWAAKECTLSPFTKTSYSHVAKFRDLFPILVILVLERYH